MGWELGTWQAACSLKVFPHRYRPRECSSISAPLDHLRNLKTKLDEAIKNGRSLKHNLTLWSRLIRARDADRCLLCDTISGISAHHIFRRVVLPIASLDTGNGITLCRECHRKVHKVFNRRPIPNDALNARGGDDLDDIAFLYGALIEDANAREIPHDEFYYLPDDVLDCFVAYQGFEELRDLVRENSSSRLRVAHEIWRWAPEAWYTKVAEDIGTELLLSVVAKNERRR
jgi:hypothetical protein